MGAALAHSFPSSPTAASQTTAGEMRRCKGRNMRKEIPAELGNLGQRKPGIVTEAGRD